MGLLLDVPAFFPQSLYLMFAVFCPWYEFRNLLFNHQRLGLSTFVHSSVFQDHGIL